MTENLFTLTDVFRKAEAQKPQICFSVGLQYYDAKKGLACQSFFIYQFNAGSLYHVHKLQTEFSLIQRIQMNALCTAVQQNTDLIGGIF